MYQPIILKYDLDSLEPYISKKTIDIHYNKHYLSYLNKLNNVLIKNNFSFNYPVHYLLLDEYLSRFPLSDRDTIIYNAGGVVNHEMYFNELIRSGREVLEPLKSMIDDSFGSFSNFVDEFSSKALSLPGSGYTFLVLDNNKLKIINLSNQDNPYSDGMIPIMNIDVWEHAYYLDYLNDRKSYINNFMKIINYEEINRNLEKVIRSKNG